MNVSQGDDLVLSQSANEIRVVTNMHMRVEKHPHTLLIIINPSYLDVSICRDR